MKETRLPKMLLLSWVPNERPIGCPRMTYGRVVKKALKRNPEIWPTLLKSLRKQQPDDFDWDSYWGSLTDDAKTKMKREHDIKMQTHWMTLAQDRESWRELTRGPEPESKPKPRAARRLRSRRERHRHNHQPQPQPQQPAVYQHNYQQAGHFDDANGQVVHRNFDD